MPQALTENSRNRRGFAANSSRIGVSARRLRCRIIVLRRDLLPLAMDRLSPNCRQIAARPSGPGFCRIIGKRASLNRAPRAADELLVVTEIDLAEDHG